MKVPLNQIPPIKCSLMKRVRSSKLTKLRSASHQKRTCQDSNLKIIPVPKQLLIISTMTLICWVSSNSDLVGTLRHMFSTLDTNMLPLHLDRSLLIQVDKTMPDIKTRVNWRPSWRKSKRKKFLSQSPSLIGASWILKKVIRSISGTFKTRQLITVKEESVNLMEQGQALVTTKTILIRIPK